MSLYDVNTPKEKEEALQDPTSGTYPMNISGRMVWERERCIGMSDAERAWRAQWLKDQILHDEPIVPKDYYKKRYNPIRRFYRYPMDQFEALLTKQWGWIAGKTIRHMVANTTILIGTMYAGYYWLKYNRGDWTRRNGPKWSVNRICMYPGDPNFPNAYHPKDNEFANLGFDKSKI